MHYLSLSINVHTVKLAADVIQALSEEYLDMPIELPNRIQENEQFWIQEHRNQVRRYDTTQC
jgi:hypothetical protein